MYDIITQIIQKQFPLSYGDGNAKPSSQSVAMWRAAHQLLEQPVVFSDDYAISILGETKENFSKNLESHKDPLSSAMRMSIAVRSRYAEDERASAIVQGAEQYVILGAGFDTYAYRSQFEHEKVFEVDLPQTQALKIQRLKQQGITPACCVDYVPCNFERGELEQNLIAAGFDKNKKSFFSCLGVVAYLDTAALQHTLQFIASCAAGSTLVFDYIVEPSTLNDIERMALGILAERLAEAGEPLKCFYHPSSLSQQLINLGFTNVRDVSPDDLNQRYLLDRQDGLKFGNVTRMFLASV